MLRKLSKKVSKVFKGKDTDNSLPPLTAAKQDHQVDTQPQEHPRRRRLSAPERGARSSIYDPHLSTLPEEPQATRPLPDQSRNGKLPLTMAEQVDRVDTRLQNRRQSRRISAPQSGPGNSSYDPYLFTPPEASQVTRPLPDQSRNGKLPINKLYTIDDEAL
jgi:hypothetical protein